MFVKKINHSTFSIRLGSQMPGMRSFQRSISFLGKEAELGNTFYENLGGGSPEVHRVWVIVQRWFLEIGETVLTDKEPTIVCDFTKGMGRNS